MTPAEIEMERERNRIRAFNVNNYVPSKTFWKFKQE